MSFLSEPWPWYVGGPLLGLVVVFLLLFANRAFGVSSSLRHLCAACLPVGSPYFQYDWKKSLWNLVFIAGLIVGAFLAGVVFANPQPVQISAETREALAALGISDFSTLLPRDLFNWNFLFTGPGFIMIVVGGFLVGFGARWAGGCTSGHGITGMADLQLASMVSVIGFFIGGLIVTHLLLPRLLGMGD